MQATIRFRQQLVDDRVELYDTCPRHAAFVRKALGDRLIEHGDAVVAVLETTPPTDAVCPYDAATCNPDNCDRHGALVPSGVEDGQLMGTS